MYPPLQRFLASVQEVKEVEAIYRCLISKLHYTSGISKKAHVFRDAHLTSSKPPAEQSRSARLECSLASSEDFGQPRMARRGSVCLYMVQSMAPLPCIGSRLATDLFFKIVSAKLLALLLMQRCLVISRRPCCTTGTRYLSHYE